MPDIQDVRVDGTGNYMPYDDAGSSTANVVALSGGGFAVQWLADTDGDDDGDTIAIQRYDAAGNEDGAVVLLTNLPDMLTNQQDNGAEAEVVDLTPLDGGGYALTYAMQLTETSRSVLVNSSPITTGISIVGRPLEITFNTPIPGSVTFFLSGTGSNGLLSFPVYAVDGAIQIQRWMIEQFVNQDRLTLAVQNNSGQQIGLNISGLQTLTYDPDSVLQTEHASLTAASNGAVQVRGGPGRVEAFDIGSVTPVGANANYFLVITPAFGAQSINLTGISGASIQPPGGPVIVISGLVPDVNGVIAVPQSILDQLDGDDASIALTITGLVGGSTVEVDMSMRTAIHQPEGIFVQTFDADGVGTGGTPVRIDGADNYMPYDDDDAAGIASVVALSGGGFAVQWLADTDGDDDGDTIAIQRYDAAGNQDGAVVLLTNLPDTLTNQLDIDAEAEAVAVALTPLDGGGYVLTYAMQLFETSHFAQVNSGPNPTAILITGRPVEINFSAPIPVGVTFTLVGTGPNGPLSVSLPVEDGEIEIPRSVIDQFTVQDRFQLQVLNSSGQQVGVNIGGVQTLAYDADSVLQTQHVSPTAGSNGLAFLFTLDRVEAFDIQAVTPVGANATYTLIITPAIDAHQISLTGIANAFVAPTGSIVITGLVPDVNGVIAVPQLLLDRLDGGDASIILQVGGLVNGSTVEADLSVREAIHQPEGIFVYTFDADGVGTGGTPVRIDGAGHYMPYDDDDAAGIASVVALSGGGFAVQWVADTDGDDDGDTIAIQRYDAAGNQDGVVVLLSDLPDTLTNQLDNGASAEAVVIELTPLDGGGYALTYAMQLSEAFHAAAQVISSVIPTNISIVGRPVEVNFGNVALPVGVTFTLIGTGPNGQLLVPLTVEDGEIEIPRSVIEQFTVQDRFTLQVLNNSGQLVNVSIGGLQTLAYDPDSVLQTQHVTTSGATNNAVFLSALGRVEAFDIQAVTPVGANATYMLFITPATAANSINLTGIAGAAFVPTGGYITITGLVPDGNGVIAVPQLLLDRLDGSDAIIALRIGGLVNGSTVEADLSVREGIHQPEGIFVHTFAVAEGNVADGYVAGATVFIDVDQDGVLDEDEPFTVTDANGDFALVSGAVGPIRALGGTNIDTGLPNLVVLSAPDGSTVVNPLTTLIQALVADGADPQDAEDQVKDAFGIASGIDLTTFDVFGEASADDPDALEAQKAAASVMVILGQVLEASGGNASALDAALDVLVDAIESGPVDLTDEALLTDVFTTTGLVGTELSDFVDATAAFNTTIQSATTVEEIADVQEAAAPSVAIAVDDSVSTAENVVGTGSLFDNNGSGADVDPDGPALAVETVNGSAGNVGSQITLASGAKLTVNADGTYSYNPNGKFNTLTAPGSGAVNTSATESFTYSLVGGGTAAVTITINGVAGAGDRLAGNGADNVIAGTTGSDFFILNQGGVDEASGGNGNDAFLFGASLTAADQVDGGAGADQLALQGNYALTLGTGLIGLESIALLSSSDTRFGDQGVTPFDYAITSVDENVASGVRMTVDASQLHVGEDLTFNGSAETDGQFFTWGGLGVDTLTGGLGNDTFYFGQEGQFGAGDTANGGPGGADQLGLRGDYTIVFGAGQLTSIESIGMVSAQDTRFGALGADYDYDFTMDENNVLTGQMTVDGSQLRSNETLTFNGAAETTGSFRVFGGAANDFIIGSQNGDILIGRDGADTMTGNGGADQFRYNAATDSTALSTDSITDFTLGDLIDLSRIDANANTGGVNDAFAFVGNTAFSNTAGELRAVNAFGSNWNILGDINGDGIEDLVIVLGVTGGHQITAADFIL